MKILKRLTALLIILNMFPFTAFADTEDTAETNDANAVNAVEEAVIASAPSIKHNEEACRFLSVLGIIDDTFAFQYDKEISRMEFARIVLNAGGYSTEGYEPKGIFSDVTTDSEYISDIEVLYQEGVISGSGGNFYPSRNVTYQEAVVMLLKAAGYAKIVEISGGDTEAYLNVARNNGLLKNVTMLDKFTGDDMVVMVYNMLMMNTIDISTPGSFSLEKRETILSSRHDVYYRKGIVYENDLTGLYTDTATKKGNISIDTGTEKVTMAVGDTDIDEKLGYCVSAYYRYDKMHDQSECIYYEFDSKNTVTIIDIGDLQDFTPDNIEYSIGEKNKKIKISGAAILYNYAYYIGSAINLSSFSGKVGKITAIDNDSDRRYDVISIEAYDTYIVGNAVAKDECIYDKELKDAYGNSVKVDISSENADKYSLKMADGKEAVFGDICEDTVLSVAKSAPLSNVKVVKVIVSTKRSSGTLSHIYTEGTKRTVVLDNIEEYRLLPRVPASSMPYVGGGVTLMLDAFDNAVYIETKYLAGTHYGFMINSKKDNREGKVYIELFTHERKIEQIPLAVKSKIDGETYRNYIPAYSYLKGIPKQPLNGGFFPEGVMPVRYTLNEDMEIKDLDTPQLGPSEDVNSLTPMGNGHKVYASNTFGFEIPINGDTTVLQISTPDKENKSYYQEFDRYSYSGISSFRERKMYTYNAYKLDPKSLYADLIVYFSSSGFDHDSRVTVIRKFDKKALDEESGEIFTVFEGISGGQTIERNIAKEYEDEFFSLGLKEGDVVRCLFDDNDRLCDVEGPILSYDTNTGDIIVDTTGDGTTDTTKIKNQETSSFVLIGDVAQRMEGLIKLHHLSWGNTYNSADSESTISGREEFLAKIDGTVPVMVYDRSLNGTGKLYSGTYDDIVAMDNSFRMHSIVLLRYRSDAIQEVVVLNGIYN